MLNIIKETRSFDLAIAYQWTAGFELELGDMFVVNGSEFASKIAAQKSKLQDNIDKMMESIAG